MARRPRQKATAPTQTARVVPLTDFDDRMDGHIFTGSESDIHVDVLPADVPLIRQHIERHIAQSPDFMGDFMVVMDSNSVEVRKWDWTFSGIKGIDPKKILISFPKKEDLVLFFDNKKIYWPKVARVGKKMGVEWEKVNPFTIWRASEHHRPTYERVVYAPAKHGEEINLPPKTLNLFQGWPLTPVMSQPEKCKLIRNHILDVICSGDPDFYQWILTWFAHKVQRPNEKIGTAISLRSRQGAGKGLLVSRTMGKIFGQHFKHLINISSVVGRFNAGFEDASLVYLDEAFFTRDKEAASALKGLITENELTQEKKYKDPSTKAVVFDIIMSTNFEQAAPIEFDDRRYTIAEIEWSMGRDEADAYFKALIHEIDNGGREAFFGLLLEWDLDEASVDIRKPYETAGRIRQKLTNLDHIPEWWFNVLTTGTFGKLSNGQAIDWDDYVGKTVPKALIAESCLAYCNRMRKSPLPSEALITRKVGAMCPVLAKSSPAHPITIKAPFDGIGPARQRAYILPEITEARLEFEAFIGGGVDWEGEDETRLETSPEFENDDASREPWDGDDVPF